MLRLFNPSLSLSLSLLPIARLFHKGEEERERAARFANIQMAPLMDPFPLSASARVVLHQSGTTGASERRSKGASIFPGARQRKR